MKKKIIALLFATLLLTSSCGLTKPAADECCKKETAIEKIVSKDPVMKLLASALIIFAINILATGGR